MPDELVEDVREYHFGDAYEGDSVVKVWCDGRERDPDTETYRPRYSYSIVTPKWRYDDNDIHGPSNALPDVDSGARSLFAFLYACQEGMPKTTTTEDGLTDYVETSNSNLFPPQVREWAYHYNEEISLLSMEPQMEEG